MVIALETDFMPGDRIKHKTNDMVLYIVVGYTIMMIDATGTVITYTVKCSSGDGEYLNLFPYEIEKAPEYSK